MLRLVMSQPSPGLLRAVRAVDTFAEWTGVAVAWLMVPLVGAVAYEVVARYIFSAPTVWSFDITYMLYGAMFMLGAAYALRVGAHIRTDFFCEKWSARTRAAIAYERERGGSRCRRSSYARDRAPRTGWTGRKRSNAPEPLFA